MQSYTRQIAIALFVLIPSLSAAAPGEIRPFIENNCIACHSTANKMAGLDLTALPLADDRPETLQTWVRIHDRVRDGEMPPKAMPRPDPRRATQFLADLSESIATVGRAQQASLGRVHARRLTRVEYENTVHDLLGIKIPLKELLPEGAANEIFDTIATSQQISHFVLEKYLNAADVALDAAYKRALEPLPTYHRKFTIADLSTRRGGNNRQPMPHPGGEMAVAWSTGLVFVGRMPKTTVEDGGWYQIRLKASAVNPDSDNRVWATLRTGECYARAPSMYWVDMLELTPEPREFVFEAWIRKNHMLQLQPGDYTFERPGYNDIRTDPYDKTFARGLAGAAIHSLEMERVFPGDTPTQARRRLFGDAEIVLNDGVRRAAVRAESPRQLAEKLIRSFAAKAFRRAVEPSEIAAYLQLFESRLAAGAPFEEALRAGYRGIMVSPKFLYLPEEPGPLDDNAVASRLSYLLSSTMPDAELRALAAEGKLRELATLRSQVERLLADPRAESFTRNFTGQWLDLRDIDFTQPDRDLFRDFDEVLKNSMLAETWGFFNELLIKDLSVMNLIDSNFMMLNTRLAKHYGLEPPKNLGLQRTALPPGSRRGGLLTQGSILKVTANGTNTSPVVRGAWVTERILGRPVPPPPPNVSAIEPDVRGAKTIREQLEAHRSNASCAACHAKIDPPGFALESYDPTGRWREKYPVIASQTERRTRWKPGPPVDPSYTLADGSPFRDLDGLKRLFKRDRQQIARNVVERLIEYGTGAKLGFADRSEVDQIVARAEESDYGLRTLLHEVVQSPLFLSK